MKTGLGLMGEGQLSLTKCLVLVDAQVNARDFHAVLQSIAQNFDVSEDVSIIPGVPLDTLDFTSYTMNLGSKMIIDATRKPKSRPGKRLPFPHAMLEGLKANDARVMGWRLWDDTLLVVQIRREGREVLEKLVRDPSLEGVKMVAVVSPDIDLEDRVSTLWGIFTRFDCARDVVFTDVRLVGPVARYSGRLGIDATFKPGYPDPLEMTEEVREKVSVRWADYGI
jgi:4-hydroxybenzoate decarboxylase subunit C